MRDLFRLIGWTVVDLFRSRAALEAEIWTLRQQINVLRRTAPKRLSFSVFDHLVFVGLYRLFPKICDALAERWKIYDYQKTRLGNLTVLENSINIVAGNGFFADKKL